MSAPQLVELERLHGQLASIDVASLRTVDLREAARRIRAIESAAQALLTVIGQQANRLQTEQLAAQAGSSCAAAGVIDCPAVGPAAASSVGPAAGSGLGSAAGPGLESAVGPPSDEPGQAALVALYDAKVSTRRNEQDRQRASVAASFPGFADALLAGRISIDHLDVLHHASCHLSEEHHAQLTNCHHRLLTQAQQNTPRHFARFVQRIIEAINADAALELALDQRAASELRTWLSPDGMGHFRGCLDPERFALLSEALERELGALANRRREAGESTTKDANLRVAALVELVARGNGSVQTVDGTEASRRRGTSSAAARASITILVDLDTLLRGPHPGTTRETSDGVALAHQTYQRHSCDALIRFVTLDRDGVPLRVGRSRRTATDAQWAALKAIYSNCAWQGCDRPVSWCQAHHIVPWEEGGFTDLENLVPLCSLHHHFVHEGRWHIALLPHRILRIRQPDGIHWADASPNRLSRPENPTERMPSASGVEGSADDHGPSG